MSRNFRAMLEAQWACGHFVCVGLDSDYAKLPKEAERTNTADTILAFNQAIVKATRGRVCAYKPNRAFYADRGPNGLRALQDTIQYIRLVAPEVPVILDSKLGDIANTNAGYVAETFDHFGADAVTVHPYLGRTALQPFLEREDVGVIVLCRTSNEDAGEFQDLPVPVPEERLRERFAADPRLRKEFPNSELTWPLYLQVAWNVSRHWNKHGNCALVVGATYPDELRQVRGIVGDMPILIPGIGAQGGDVEKTVLAGRDSRGQGMIVNASRSIIFASNGPDFAEAAGHETERLGNLINQYR